MSWDITEDFEYFVVKREQAKKCFGATLPRETLPLYGPSMSSFMRHYTPELRPKLGPGSHVDGRGAFYKVTNRHYSKLGLGPKAPRFVTKYEYQPPPYEAPQKQIKKNCAPFNSTTRRKIGFVMERGTIPSPCDYLPDYKRTAMKFRYSFGGKKSLMCPVQIKCVPYNLDACGVCGCSCSDQGDYWEFENRIFLCRVHYDQLFEHCLSKYQGARLSDFKPVRDCFFAHAHNSCKAAMKIMTHEDITKKLRKEAYLDLFFPLRRFCAV